MWETKMPGEATSQEWQDRHTTEDETLQEFYKQAAASTVTNNDVQKPKLFHTCGISLVIVVQKAHHRLERFPGPVGILTRKFSPMATPIVQPIYHTILSLLEFTDATILPKISAIVVSAFPSSADMLEKLGHVAEQIAESLPEEFDRAMDRLPSIARRIPIIEWIFWLTMSNSTTDWSKVDDLGPVEAEEKILSEDDDDDGGSDEEEEWKERGKEKEEVEEEKEMVTAVDEIPILELFEEGWHTTKEEGREEMK